MLSRKNIKLYNYIAQKHGNVGVKDFQKKWKINIQPEQTQTIYRFSKKLQTTWCVSEILYP